MQLARWTLLGLRGNWAGPWLVAGFVVCLALASCDSGGGGGEGEGGEADSEGQEGTPEGSEEEGTPEGSEEEGTAEGSEEEGTPEGSAEEGTPEGSEEEGEPGPQCEPQEVLCEDEAILQLSLKKNIAAGIISEIESDGGSFLHLIDARGGGSPPSESYVYAKFTDSGLEKVEISDEQAIGSMDWHLAFRRYVIRLNSGVSGPNCVQGAGLIAFDFNALTKLPPGVAFKSEGYFSGACGLIEDDSGLPGSPNTVMAKFWNYAGCVSMTNQIYAIALPDGRHVKAMVESYYSPDFQEECQSAGSVPMGNNGAGNIRLRWGWLSE